MGADKSKARRTDQNKEKLPTLEELRHKLELEQLKKQYEELSANMDKVLKEKDAFLRAEEARRRTEEENKMRSIVKQMENLALQIANQSRRNEPVQVKKQDTDELIMFTQPHLPIAPTLVTNPSALMTTPPSLLTTPPYLLANPPSQMATPTPTPNSGVVETSSLLPTQKNTGSRDFDFLMKGNSPLNNSHPLVNTSSSSHYQKETIVPKLLNTGAIPKVAKTEPHVAVASKEPVIPKILNAGAVPNVSKTEHHIAVASKEPVAPKLSNTGAIPQVSRTDNHTGSVPKIANAGAVPKVSKTDHTAAACKETVVPKILNTVPIPQVSRSEHTTAASKYDILPTPLLEETPEILLQLRNTLPRVWSLKQHCDPKFLFKHFLIPLTDTDQEYKTVSRRFITTLKQGRKITSIQRIENFGAWLMFNLKHKECIQKYGAKNVKIRQLFFGTHSKEIPNICKNNFNWRDFVIGRKCNSPREYFGLTFSPMASQASYQCRSKKKLLVLASVLVCHEAPRVEPGSVEVPPGDHDSTVRADGKLICKYDDHHFYPEYVIQFVPVSSASQDNLNQCD